MRSRAAHADRACLPTFLLGAANLDRVKPTVVLPRCHVPGRKVARPASPTVRRVPSLAGSLGKGGWDILYSLGRGGGFSISGLPHLLRLRSVPPIRRR